MILFELIQIVLGNRIVLSHTPSAEEWEDIYFQAERQAILGICFQGAQQLQNQEQYPPRTLLYKWIAVAEQIKKRNLLLNKRCQELQQCLLDLGIRNSILKGQGIANLYKASPHPILKEQEQGRLKYETLGLLRQPGDIDIYVDCGREKAIQLAHELGQEQVDWDYKHLHLDVWSDTEVEMHYRVEVLLNLWKNRKLQRWFDAHAKVIFDETDKGGLTTPSTSFNLFYILLHIYRHFLYEGVGLRQLMDYYFVLRHANDTDATDVTKTLKEFGMMRFARGVMWVMKDVFALERAFMICEPLESEGRYILQEVMAGGNFGHHDSRLKRGRGKLWTIIAVCKHNWHLVSHYPNDVIWAPVWFVWHKCWKLTR